MKTYRAPPQRQLEPLSPRIRRRKPRSYFEWSTLRRWETLPSWEESPAGYLLRSAREEAGLTQHEMGIHLDCSQQAVAQAERSDSNPTIGFARCWATALDKELHVSIE